MIKVYGVRGYGSAIAETMLALASEPYEFVDVDGFDKPGPTHDKLFAVNPLCQVPTLVLDDGSVLTETAAICLWLASRQPETMAPPPSTPEHARFLRLLIWLVANMYPTFTYGDYPERWCPSQPDELVAKTNAYRERLWLWFEEQVAGPYVLGEYMSALDCYIAVMVDWHPRLPWFTEHTPKTRAVAELTRRHPRLREVLIANKMHELKSE